MEFPRRLQCWSHKVHQLKAGPWLNLGWSAKCPPKLWRQPRHWAPLPSQQRHRSWAGHWLDRVPHAILVAIPKRRRPYVCFDCFCFFQTFPKHSQNKRTIFQLVKKRIVDLEICNWYATARHILAEVPWEFTTPLWAPCSSVHLALAVVPSSCCWLTLVSFQSIEDESFFVQLVCHRVQLVGVASFELFPNHIRNPDFW